MDLSLRTPWLTAVAMTAPTWLHVDHYGMLEAAGGRLPAVAKPPCTSSSDNISTMGMMLLCCCCFFPTASPTE